MQKISIKNFFAIQEAEFHLEKMLLLIGEQASGKSTVAKLVYFFKSLPREILTNISLDETLPENSSGNEFFSSIRRAIRKKFYAFFGSTKHLNNFDIKYFFNSGKYIHLSLNQDKSLKVYFSSPLYRPLFEQQLPGLIQAARQGYSQRQGGFDAEVAYLSTLRDIEKFVNDLFEDTRRPFFIPAGRNITVGFGELFESRFERRLGRELEAIENRVENKKEEISPSVDLYLINEFLERVARMKDRFKNSDFEGMIDNQILLAHDSGTPSINGNQSPESSASSPDRSTRPSGDSVILLDIALKKITEILKGRYVLDRYGEKIYFADDKYVDLNDASSGQQEAIRVLQDIFLVLLDREPAFRVIEEPEAHLYPMAQKQLIELFAFVLNYTDSQMIITTHSPYVLSVFNNLLYATRVASINPKAHEEIAETIPASCWLDPDRFYAYALKDGFCQSIIDRETGLIDQNFLDEISEELGDEFNILYSLHAESMRA